MDMDDTRGLGAKKCKSCATASAATVSGSQPLAAESKYYVDDVVSLDAESTSVRTSITAISDLSSGVTTITSTMEHPAPEHFGTLITRLGERPCVPVATIRSLCIHCSRHDR